MAAEEKTKQQLTKKVKAKEANETIMQDNEVEFAGDFPSHPPQKGMNKRQHRQKKQ